LHNRARNILIIVQNLPIPFDRRVWQEATSLCRAGFGVALVSPKKNMYTKSYEINEGVDIFRYPLIYEANKGVLGYCVEFVYCWLASLWMAVRAYIHRPFQVIHACNPPDTFFALAMLFRPFGVRFVFDHHDLCPEMYVAKGRNSSGPLYRGLVLLERLTLRFADRVIAVNESHREVAVSRGGIDSTKVKIVRSGPRRFWANIEAADPALKRGRAYLVVYLGEMCEQDGVDHLLRAISYYTECYPRDTLFAFIGGGPHQARMRELATRMGLADSVIFTGRISDEELWKYLATADVCVDPDPLTAWSNMSTMNKIIEYMAFGKPIVAFDLLENFRSAGEAAVFVEPNDDYKLGMEIRALLLDQPQREVMGRYAQHRFCEYLAWEKSEQELIAMYFDLLGADRALLRPERGQS
jgi:glycosyltransferase involved in cell wall biosynthesis